MANKAKQVVRYLSIMLELELAFTKAHQIQLCIRVYSSSLPYSTYSKNLWNRECLKNCVETTQR